MRLILDAYILLSALLSPLGAPAKLLDAWERKTFTLVACDALIAELRDVAARPFFRARLRASVAELLAAGLRDFSFFCRDLPSGPIAPDPKDSYLAPVASLKFDPRPSCAADGFHIGRAIADLAHVGQHAPAAMPSTSVGRRLRRWVSGLLPPCSGDRPCDQP